MAFTEAEEARIQAIETVLNQMQIAIKNLAAKQQMRQLMLLKQGEVNSIGERVTSLESQIAILQEAL
jgi:polyhydroxyalkanoate synthesis regulator phasin